MTEGLPKIYDKSIFILCADVRSRVAGGGARVRAAPLAVRPGAGARLARVGAGARGGDISPFVHKVVFHLHPPSAFVYPKRVLQEPPYEIQESGCASIDIPIHVYLKCTSKPKKIRLRYRLNIENNSITNTESKYIYYDFVNPQEQLCVALMKGGGEIVARKGCSKGLTDDLSGLFSDDEKIRKYQFVEPIQKQVCGKGTKAYIFEEICSKCSVSGLKKQLRTVAMTDDEINKVSQLYLAYRSYEKSVDALILPPISDPIYALPELPASLKGAGASIESDYAMQ